MICFNSDLFHIFHFNMNIQIEKTTLIAAPAHSTTGAGSITTARGALTIATKRGTNTSAAAASATNTSKSKAPPVRAATQKKRGVDPAFFPSGLVNSCPSEPFPGGGDAGTSAAVVHTMPKRGRTPVISKASSSQSNQNSAPVYHNTAAATGSTAEGVHDSSRTQTTLSESSFAHRNGNSTAAPAAHRKNIPAQTAAAVSAPPAPPRFFKRKFGATTALATPAWEDNEM